MPETPGQPNDYEMSFSARPAVAEGIVEEKVPLDETEIQTDQEGAILSGAVETARTIIAKYSQVNEEGGLDYYFAGSLATMLLARADRIDHLKSDALPRIEAVSSIPVPVQATTILKNIARPIGDIDIVVLPEYQERAKRAIPAYDSMDRVPQAEAQGDWITQGIRIELSKATEAVVSSLKSDVKTGKDAARIVADGQEFYIPDPRVMLDYKALHLIFDFARTPNKDKLVNDFSILAEGLSVIYGREELVRGVHDSLTGNPNVVIPTYHQRFDSISRAFFEEVCAGDENAQYLGSLETGPERSMGMLNILRNYQTPEAKQAIVAFVNDHQQQLDQWRINPNDPDNQHRVADHIRQNPAEYEPMLESRGIAMETIEEWLQSNTGMVTQYASDMPTKDGLVMYPVHNHYLNILAKLDETAITRELAVLEGVMAIPSRYPESPGGLEVRAIFESGVARVPDLRTALFEGISIALEMPDQARLQEFLKELRQASELVPAAPMGVEASQVEPWFSPIAECFRRFGLPFPS